MTPPQLLSLLTDEHDRERGAPAQSFVHEPTQLLFEEVDQLLAPLILKGDLIRYGPAAAESVLTKYRPAWIGP